MTLALVFLSIALLAAVAVAVAQMTLLRSRRDWNAKQAELIETLEELIAIKDERIDQLLKFACCGCGHSLLRHDDPDGDGFGCRDCNCQAIHRLDEPEVGRR